MNRAFIGRLASRGWVRGRDVAIWELAEWPTLFEGLWSYKDSVQMLSALTHLILCGDRIKHGFLNYQDLVDAYGSLEAAVRFWNGLESDYFFRSKGSCSLRAQLRRAVSGFRMGDRRLDLDEVLKIVKQASEYRDKLAHGNAGGFYHPDNVDESERLLGHGQYFVLPGAAGDAGETWRQVRPSSSWACTFLAWSAVRHAVSTRRRRSPPRSPKPAPRLTSEFCTSLG